VDTTASVVIDRPIDEVFRFLADVRNMPQWVSGVTGAAYVDGDAGLGAAFRITYGQGWRDVELQLEVTDYEAPTRFGMQIVRGPFTFDGRFELAPEAGSTRVSNSVEAGADSLASELAMLLFGPLIRRSMSGRLQRELEALRDAMSGGSVRT
jgi:uncharacterized protein YndB with AHSA1/START domain